MNYGAIGQIIGHEITHGFDDQGRQFDLNGNLEDWWQADTQKQFLEKARCIIEQYAQYTSVKTNLTVSYASQHKLRFSIYLKMRKKFNFS